MNKSLIFIIFTLFNINILAAENVEPGSFEEQAKQYKWLTTVNPELPNVLIIGDSISIGYTLGVRAKLKDIANVYRPIQEQGKAPQNGGDTRKGLKTLESWLQQQNVKHWDVIHFNWGLHDLKRITKGMGVKSNDTNKPSAVSVEQYGKNLETLVKRMKLTGAKLIFATTTAYPVGVTPARIPEDAKRYNDAAIEIMTKYDVSVNDLYAEVKPNLNQYQLPQNVHFNKQGSEFLATKVSIAIKKHLPTK